MQDLIKFFARLCIMLGIPIIAGVLVYVFMDNVFFKAGNPEDSKEVLFEVIPGKTFKSICQELEKQKLVRYWQSVYYTSKIRGTKQKINPGEYGLSANLTPKEILAKLLEGKVYKRKVVVEPGMRIEAVAALVEKAGLVSKDTFVKKSMDKEFLIKAGLSSDSFEGYLTPGNYEFEKSIGADRIIWSMLENGEKGWTSEFQERADELGFSREEILILASIVQKESENGKAEEQPVISSVLHNRLRNAMKLWSKTTVAYGLKKFGQILNQEDFQTSTPYNTFIKYGLPAGPICNPGGTAIYAALYPEETTYLFFIPDGLGGHIFARTEREYQDAIAKKIKGD